MYRGRVRNQNQWIDKESVIADLQSKYESEFNIVKEYFLSQDRASIIKDKMLKFVEAIGKEKEFLDFQKRKVYKAEISQSQIRKHYNYFLDICQDVEYKGWKEEEHLVKLAMEKVYINYDFARDNVNYFFKRFVEDLIDEVKDEETLKDAQVLFEALVGYSKVFIEK